MIMPHLLRNQQGMILFTSLLILSFLIALGVGSVVSVQSEYRITDNLRSGTSALYIAEAGAEWAKQQLLLSRENPPVVADATRDFSNGQFSVAFLSSTRASPLASEIVYRSDGRLRTATQTVQAQVRKSYDLADAALVLRGNSRGVQLAANSFAISGLDYDPISATPLTDARERPAISVGAAMQRAQFQDALNPSQRTFLTGTDSSGASISLSDRLASEAILRLVSGVCASAQAQSATLPSEGRLLVADQVWGNSANPQIRCIEGLSQSGDQVSVNGSLIGAGILVIRDVSLVLSGSFRWDGLVVITGNDVGVRVSGEESKEIYGALIVNETGPALGAGDPLVDVQGNVRIRFSRAALAAAARLIPSVALDNLYSSLPAYMSQDYWRIVTP